VRGSTQEFLKGTVKLVVLATLADTAKYGYLIIKEIEGLSNNFFDLREGTLYPILHSLEDEGFVKSEWKVSESGRDRRYYKMTPKGRQAMLKQKENWTKMVKAVNAAVSGAKV
jgi:transcriptional regulator